MASDKEDALESLSAAFYSMLRDRNGSARPDHAGGAAKMTRSLPGALRKRVGPAAAPVAAALAIGALLLVGPPRGAGRVAPDAAGARPEATAANALPTVPLIADCLKAGADTIYDGGFVNVCGAGSRAVGRPEGFATTAPAGCPVASADTIHDGGYVNVCPVIAR
jgi:hypothetical protein